MINTSILLIDSVILTIIFSVFVIGSFLWKPRIWLHDFPQDLQELSPPKTPEEKRLTTMFALPFFIVLFGGLGLSAAHYGTTNGFVWMMLHIYLVWMIVNLWDLVVIDWGGMLLINPDNPPFPGTEGAKGYRDYMFHFVGFLKGSVMGIVLTAIVAGVVWILYS